MKLLLFLSLLSCLDFLHAYFVTIDAHSEECFHERVEKKAKMALIFEVAQGGFLDIDVTVCVHFDFVIRFISNIS